MFQLMAEAFCYFIFSVKNDPVLPQPFDIGHHILQITNAHCNVNDRLRRNGSDGRTSNVLNVNRSIAQQVLQGFYR